MFFPALMSLIGNWIPAKVDTNTSENVSGEKIKVQMAQAGELVPMLEVKAVGLVPKQETEANEAFDGSASGHLPPL